MEKKSVCRTKDCEDESALKGEKKEGIFGLVAFAKVGPANAMEERV